ncbi:putative dithiol-disulfide isomerase involved in polyketide biosynthesis [Frankia canadensis]|uniref:Putative dithiol-disulfide isomerase involved in polyketide biosynthesis n=1 Tax=Frankia canadensis TaxID=1836972 RepID=A0A2I2KSX0_9ACTN|nr:DsbA family oxidoreductase [Frankia canadensis]SNQ48729.1 putative dithiol-disulfide isomerase involved in polyketide biosynthesis [Frankia canadensis]SOU56019.1 putative dithiol-disulfide isomerase involved in polyketide biosynthesis [Frankia canadensis]
MRVDIWSDVVCPWCYVGKARFDRALDAFEHRGEVVVHFHSYELAPGLPRGGSEPLLDALARKVADVPAAEIARREHRVADAARAEGLDYRSDRRNGSTFDLHRLLHLAADAGRRSEAVAALNQAHFGAARDVFDPEVAVEVFTGAGLDPVEIRRVLAGDAYADRVFADERAAHDLRITGVPFVVIDGTVGVSGARPTELFTRALDQAWARRPRQRVA